MKLVVALLATVLLVAGCGEDGAEPGASSEATLVLDFTPNAVHSGIYAADAKGYFEDAGIDLTIRQPGDSTDAPKLLAAGRTDFAVMDINDLGAAYDRGIDVVAFGALVQVPLASVIAGDGDQVKHPRDLEGRTVGVTGLPSDDAVLDAVVAGDGGDPAKVDRTNIGFDSVAALSAGRVDAATAFWNAEGVQLRDLGVPTREFRVGDSTDPYPELVVVTTRDLVASQPELITGVRDALVRGYGLAASDPDEALSALLDAVPQLDRSSQEAQMDALSDAEAFADGVTPGSLDPQRFQSWASFAARNGIEIPAQAGEVAGLLLGS